MSPPTLSDSDDVAQVSKPSPAVPSSEYGMWLISHGKLIVAELGLADSNTSSIDSVGEDSAIQSPLRKKDKMSYAR